MNQAGTNPDTFEALSAGIDGELSKEQLRFLLRRLSHDASLQQAWSRYHVAGDGLRGQVPLLAGPGFARRVLQAIEQESKPALTSRRRNHWLRWSAGGAIAASVAAAALMIAQPPVGEAERMTAAVIQPAGMADAGTPPSKPAAPAAVPPWLSGNSAGLLSQQASATLGAPFGQARPVYSRRLSGYPSMPHYRTFDNNDGSYMVLLDPEQPVGQTPSRQASAVAH
ncbi:MAG TPA: sigma-E factor negative regulatory protein [Rhodanobacter sp.]